MTGPAIAVAWQSRFVDGKWSECSREHVEWVRSVPHEWPGYEVRELYAAPQPAPAIDLEQFREAVSYASSAAAVNTHTELEARFRSLLTLIDGQASKGCGACGDGCVTRGSCRVRDESPPCKIEQPTKGEGE